MSDLDLARRVLAGSEPACEEFFANYFPRVYRFARLRLGDDDAAEEVAQATLVQAVRKLHTYRGEAALFTWLCTLCRHEVASRLARAGRSAEVSLIEDRPDTRAVLEALAAAKDDPEVEAGRRELSGLVQATLEHLPVRYGQALEWKYIEGASVDEIGIRLGLGYKATESLLTRAREAFREGFSAAIGGWPPALPRAAALRGEP